MKSERKQIQESNLLADKIEQMAIKLKTAMPAILAVTTVVVLGLLAFGFYTSVKETESAKGWTKLYFADTDASDLTAISTDFSGTTAGLWAKQTAADANMSRALEKVYLDRDLAEEFYKEAIADYKSVAEKSSDSFLVGRANYGLAQASEGMGDSEKALSYYRKVIANKGMGAELIAEATKRVAFLESDAGVEFYTWFKANRASAPVLNASPGLNTPLPSNPDIAFPPKPSDASTTKPADLAPAATPVPTTTEAATPVVPAPATPEAPAADAPKVDDAPAEKKPQS
jgi:tetratricopeptide (TPR) repeat protein